ncbi:MAG: lysylphosphatidylglycerol synthase transmembrane domain-containing protein [Elusimicrobiota bacterium]
MKASWRHALSLFIGAAVSLGLLCFAFRNVAFSKFVDILGGLRPEWIPVLLALPVLDLWVRSMRWKLLLEPAASAPVSKLMKLECIGLGLNNLLFFRMGELARGYFTATALGIPLWSALATILVERLCDTAALLALFGACSFGMEGIVSPSVQKSALAAAAAFTALLVGISALEHLLERFAFWRRLEGAHPRLRRFIEELVLGTGALRRPSRAVLAAFLSLGLWLCDAGLYWAAGRALGFEPGLSYLRSVAVLASASAASALPALPGAFGNFEAAVKLVLEHMGYGPDLSAVYATLVHLTMYVVVTVLGIFFLHRLGYRVSGIKRTLGEGLERK